MCRNSAQISIRQAWVTQDGVLRFGRPKEGGIWLYSHCHSCNSEVASVDDAYCKFAQIVRRGMPRVGLVLPGYRWRAPADEIRPGAIARSVLAGMFAFNPSLRELIPGVADMVATRSSDPVELPQDVRLRLALYPHRRARVSGSYVGWYVPLGPQHHKLGLATHAGVYFAPLAWHLEMVDIVETSQSIFQPMLETWADVSVWTTVEPDLSLSAEDVADVVECAGDRKKVTAGTRFMKDSSLTAYSHDISEPAWELIPKQAIGEIEGGLHVLLH